MCEMHHKLVFENKAFCICNGFFILCDDYGFFLGCLFHIDYGQWCPLKGFCLWSGEVGIILLSIPDLLPDKRYSTLLLLSFIHCYVDNKLSTLNLFHCYCNSTRCIFE